MEVVYTTSNFQYGHEVIPGQRVTPPELVPQLDAEGNEVTDPAGNPVLVPHPDWEPIPETIQMDAILVIEPGQRDANVFKFAFGDKESLANFLAFYVQFLDADARQTVRQSLEETSPVVLPEFAPSADVIDNIVPLNREQRRKIAKA